MKIKALQVGGMLGYSVADIPRARQSKGKERAQPEETEKSEDEQILSKSNMEALVKDGLSNDVDAFLEQLNRITQTSINPKQAAQLLNKQRSDLNKVLLNKANFTEAIASANANNGLGEIAITTTGQIIVENQETGKIDQVSAAQLKDNMDILRPLTNSELAHRRQTDPALAFNTSIATVIGNGVGPDKITEYIFKIAKEVGTTKQTSEGYVNKKEQNIAEGFKLLMEGGVDGIYKASSTQESKMMGANSQMQQALSYIYTMLPLNMKNFLRATSATQGLDPEKGAYKLIQDMMTSTVDITNEDKVDFDKEQTDRAGGDDGGSGEKESLNLEQSVLMASGRGVSKEYALNTGTENQIVIEGEFYQTPFDKQNKPINRSMTLQKLFTDTQVAGIINPGAVYIGDKKLSESEFGNVVYDNKNGMMITSLPYKLDGEGNKVVNLTAIESIAAARDEIKLRGLTLGMEKEKVYEEYGVKDYYNMMEVSNSITNNKLMTPFLMFSGITTDESDYGIDGFDSKSRYLEVDGPHKSAQISTFESAVTADTKSAKPIDARGSWFFNIGGGEVITGTVYVPLSDDQISIYSSNSLTRIPKSNANVDRLIRNQVQLSKQLSLSNTTANSLD